MFGYPDRHLRLRQMTRTHSLRQPFFLNPRKSLSNKWVSFFSKRYTHDIRLNMYDFNGLLLSVYVVRLIPRWPFFLLNFEHSQPTLHFAFKSLFLKFAFSSSRKFEKIYETEKVCLLNKFSKALLSSTDKVCTYFDLIE